MDVGCLRSISDEDVADIALEMFHSEVIDILRCERFELSKDHFVERLSIRRKSHDEPFPLCNGFAKSHPCPGL